MEEILLSCSSTITDGLLGVPQLSVGEKALLIASADYVRVLALSIV